MKLQDVQVMDLFSLKGKVAVVTGGAGLYGKQVGIALAQAGAKVYISSRRREQLAVMEDDYRQLGCEVTALQLDQSDEASVEAFKAQILADNDGRVDILVNNAVARGMMSWDDTEGFKRSMDANAFGLYLVTRAFGDVMQQRGSGSIINIGSIQGVIGPDASLYEGLDMKSPAPDYFFHKGGMQNFTRFVASHYGPSGVRCNCVNAGGLRSERNSEVFAERYGKRTLLNRMANETDLLGTIVFLASDASLYVTGAILALDGGYTAK